MPSFVTADHRAYEVFPMNPAADQDTGNMYHYQSEPNVRKNLMSLFQRLSSDLLKPHVPCDSGCEPREQHRIDRITACRGMPDVMPRARGQAAQILDRRPR